MEKKSIYQEPIFWLTVSIFLACSLGLKFIMDYVFPDLNLEFMSSTLLVLDLVGGAGLWILIFPALFSKSKKVSVFISVLLFFLLNMIGLMIFYYLYSIVFNVKTIELSHEFGVYFALFFLVMVVNSYVQKKKGQRKP